MWVYTDTYVYVYTYTCRIKGSAPNSTICVSHGVWGGGVHSIPIRNVWAPARYPIIQLDSDTAYPEMASDSTRKGFSSTKLSS